METKATKILAIDDNYDNLIVLNALLNESFPSAQLFTSQSGKKGIELCREHKPDVILLDIVMPVMDGYEVCRTLKNNTEFKNIPVVMVTAARTDRESRIKAIEAGADGFLTKPLDESEFIAQVKAMLRIKESEDRKLDEKERLEKLVKERTEALEAELQERRKAEQELNDSLTKLKKSKEVVMLLMRDLESEIEDRKRIEQSLNETNLKYAEAQRLAHIGNFEEDLRTNETKWSEEKYRIFGIPIGTPVKWKDVKRCISIEDQVRLDQALRNALKGSNHFSIVFKIIRPDGEFRYIKEENAVIKDQHGKPIRIVGTSQDITDLKLAENALKESEEHFQLLFNYAPIGYQSLDEKGFLIDVNNAWLEIFGYSKEEVIGKWFGDFLVPQFKDAFKERFPLFKKWGKVHSEFEMLKKDGTQIIVAFDGRIGHALSGEFKQTHCVLNDITEQRRNELELKESYDFTNSLLKTIPFGIDIVDKEGNILFQNENFKKYFGIDAIGKKCWEVYRDKKTQCENCPLKNKIKIGVTEVCESPGIHQSKTFEISHTGMMFKGEKAMLEIFQDVTERKRTELIQKVLYSISYAVITTKDLEEFSTFIMKQLSLLIDTTNFRIVSYDEDTDMLISQYYSDQKEELTSWSAGNTLTGYLIKQDRSLILKKEEVYELIRRGEVGPKGTPCEIWLGVPLREEGKVIGAFVLQNYEDANAYSAKDLEMLEFISTQISISIQRKKALQDLMKALEKAEESDKLKTAFLSNMSHEIRSPMNGILGFSELLYDEDLSIEERRKFLDIINTNGQHLLSIINDILDFARIDSNQLTVSKKPFDLHPLLDDLLVSYENSKITIGKAQIKFLLEKEPGGDKRMIISDEVRLRQILFNLLSNALKFTTNGFIKFGYTLSDNKLKFFVQDTGKGISKENQSIVFERFRQEEESYTRQFGGTGLGLSISKKLVELLGGEMWLVSTQGIGTTFYFTIPYTVSLKSREHENDFSISNVSN